MLVVAFALSGRVDIDLTHDPVGVDGQGRPVFLRDLWPPQDEIRTLVERTLKPEIFQEKYRTITQGDAHWESLDVPKGVMYPWNDASTYLRDPPYFDLSPPAVQGTLVDGARVLAVLGDRVSTDHISPAGEIPEATPAGTYLREHGVPASQFNTYGARRGNHEVMVRGTFANLRLQNQLVAPREGGWTVHLPTNEVMPIFDAAERYRSEKVPLVILAGASYGQGSSRDWAAKGPRLLGVRAVIAQSYERIHRSNLVGMGILPLEFLPGESVKQLALTGRERLSIAVPDGTRFEPRSTLDVAAASEDGTVRNFRARSRIDSATDLDYFRKGGILPFVLDHLAHPPSSSTRGGRS